MRVYELAKELGVDNKVVIAKAMELGIPGIKSHSNSMANEDADQIRRALLRSTVTTPKFDTLTQRADKVTGETEAVVERRKGNIIRRRRAQDEDIIALTPTPEPEKPEKIEEEPEHIPQNIEVVPESAEASDERKVEKLAEEKSEEKVDETGPKSRILGRIELPAGRKPVAPQRTHRANGNAAQKISFFDEEEIQAKAKKGKRREVSKFDLVSYDRENRRSGRPHRKEKKLDQRTAEEIEATKMKASKRVVKMGDTITVGDLAKQMSLKAGEVIGKLMQLGVMATINQVIDKDIATIVAEEFEYSVESTSVSEEQLTEEVGAEDLSNLQPRPPVVTVMGHVDHGKTSLLDAIRSSAVAEKEHGGITQHIGAYKVTKNGKDITFIDTPGHAAFTQMRARGAQVTDIVILVVAADDGVMPQTIEALNHAKAAEVPIVVAVNKMDKPNVNPDRVKHQLAEQGLSPEEWGGDTMFVPVSALAKTGLDDLLEAVLLQAEVLELKANPDSRAKGTVIEARQDRGRGTVATVLVQSGSLNIGDIFVCGAQSGRVRSMTDHLSNKVQKALPSTPVEITGFAYVPSAGDDFLVVESEAVARQVVEMRAAKKAAEDRALSSGRISLEEFSRRANQLAELNVIVKADVHGSSEAVRHAIEQLTTEKVRVRVVHSAVGGITESDVQLAIASKALIVGFNVRAEARAAAEAERAGIQLRFYRIIYELIDDVKRAMVGLLEPERVEEHLGRAVVKKTFVVPKLGTIAGSYVKSGTIKRGSLVRLVRDGVVVFEGKMGSLKRFKDDVKEVAAGYECGIGIEGYNDIKPGDEIEVYQIKEIAPEL
jgi:translation initiation factor IF-2